MFYRSTMAVTQDEKYLRQGGEILRRIRTNRMGRKVLNQFGPFYSLPIFCSSKQELTKELYVLCNILTERYYMYIRVWPVFFIRENPMPVTLQECPAILKERAERGEGDVVTRPA